VRWWHLSFFLHLNPSPRLIALIDYVRLRAGLAPPHWRPGGRKDKWDSGYATTGLFLNWIEKRYGDGTISDLNQVLGLPAENSEDGDDGDGGGGEEGKKKKWDEDVFKKLTGRKVDKLWTMYWDDIDSEKPGNDDGKTVVQSYLDSVRYLPS
jgi:hypothetical protein